jgi:rhamnogalacturonyl hydrolase YesR
MSKQVSAIFLLVLVFSLFPLSKASADYASIAEAQTDFIQAHFYDPDLKLYIKQYPTDTSPSDTWGNGVQLEALADATRYDKAKYSEMLQNFTDGIQAYWDPAGPFGDYNATRSGVTGDDRYYDDNEWLVLGFVDAYEATNDAHYLELAKKTQQFVLSGWDDKLGGGIYWNTDHKSKNTCSNAPAAAAALRLAEVTNDETQVAWAIKIRNWTNTTLQAPDSLFWDNINLNRKIGRQKYTYNTALMIWTNVLLFQHTKDSAYLKTAKQLADASIDHWRDPQTGSLNRTEDGPLFTHLLCLSLIKLYEASHDVTYLNAVRSEASFALHHAVNPSGGFYDRWTAPTHDPDAPETLILSAAAARIFWMLAPYPDVDRLYRVGVEKAGKGDYAGAEDLLQQAVASDPSDVKSKFRLWHVYLHEHKTDNAKTLQDELISMSNDPVNAQQLSTLGWKATPTAQ